MRAGGGPPGDPSERAGGFRPGASGVPGPVGIVGTGLIGTSIGLALAREGERALVVDADPARAEAAAALGAGVAVPLAGLAGCGHVVVATPPGATAQVVSVLQELAVDATISDVGSVKTSVQRDIETLTSTVDRFCGGHPLAGRERGGPGAARPDLFDGAVWVLTPSPRSSERAAADAERVARGCGARVVRMSPEEHDAALAVVSHTPQFVASVLAAQLAAAGPDGPVLAATGFRDTTRLADSDPDLWTEIAARNAGAITPSLRRVAAELERVARAVETADGAAVRAALEAGNAARARLPGKGVRDAPRWARVGVVVPDRAGELARLLAAAATAGVNVEDLVIEHVPGRGSGFVELLVAPGAVDPLLAALAAGGWRGYAVAR